MSEKLLFNEWYGKECHDEWPDEINEDELVTVLLKDGEIITRIYPEDLRWDSSDSSDDIVGWKYYNPEIDTVDRVSNYKDYIKQKDYQWKEFDGLEVPDNLNSFDEVDVQLKDKSYLNKFKVTELDWSVQRDSTCCIIKYRRSVIKDDYIKWPGNPDLLEHFGLNIGDRVSIINQSGLVSYGLVDAFEWNWNENNGDYRIIAYKKFELDDEYEFSEQELLGWFKWNPSNSNIPDNINRDDYLDIKLRDGKTYYKRLTGALRWNNHSNDLSDDILYYRKTLVKDGYTIHESNVKPSHLNPDTKVDIILHGGQESSGTINEYSWNSDGVTDISYSIIAYKEKDDEENDIKNHPVYDYQENGGSFPASLKLDDKIDYVLRNGNKYSRSADELNWSILNSPGDIIKYRIHDPNRHSVKVIEHETISWKAYNSPVLPKLDYSAVIKVALEEIMLIESGKKQEFDFPDLDNQCEPCKGNGFIGESKCTKCFGTGYSRADA